MLGDKVWLAVSVPRFPNWENHLIIIMELLRKYESEISLYAAASRFPFIGTKGPGPNGPRPEVT